MSRPEQNTGAQSDFIAISRRFAATVQGVESDTNASFELSEDGTTVNIVEDSVRKPFLPARSPNAQRVLARQRERG